MADDPPADVLAVLTQLLAETRTALAEGDRETARETVSSAETVASNKLPGGERRDALLHGCGRVRSLLDPDDGDVEADVATEYVAAMERRLPEE